MTHPLVTEDIIYIEGPKRCGVRFSDRHSCRLGRGHDGPHDCWPCPRGTYHPKHSGTGEGRRTREGTAQHRAA